MTLRRYLIAGAGLYCLVTGPAAAQDDAPSVAAGALTTEKAPNTTVVGQTKPPSRDASPASVKPIERPTPRQAADDAIASKVCIGCKPDPATTSALPEQAGATASQERAGTKLEELRTMAPPQQQPDLDTAQLASAHRERAKSVEEKTDGLWQSWLVSVCEGCGNQRPARALRFEQWPDRTVPLTTGTIDKKAAAEVPPTESKPASPRPPRSLEADLSPENVDSIRKMPPR